MKWEQGWCGKRKTLVSKKSTGIFLMKIKNAPLHFHKKSTEYYFIISGKGEISLDNKKFKVKDFDCIEIKPLQKHQLNSSKEMKVLVISTPLVKIEDHYI